MSDWITQNDAAELRGVSVQVINNWVRRGHIKTTELYGKTLVSKSDVLSYEPSKGGRPKIKTANTKVNKKQIKGE